MPYSAYCLFFVPPNKRLDPVLCSIGKWLIVQKVNVSAGTCKQNERLTDQSLCQQRTRRAKALDKGFHFEVFSLTNIQTINHVLLTRKKISTHPPVHVPCVSNRSGGLRRTSYCMLGEHYSRTLIQGQKNNFLIMACRGFSLS